MEPSYFAPYFYGALETLPCKIKEKWRPCPAKAWIINKLDFLINTFRKNLFKILYKKKLFDRMVSLMNEFSSPHLFCCLSQIDHEIIFSDWS